MSTKQETSTTQNVTYDPASKSTYDTFLGQASTNLLDQMKDPLKSGWGQAYLQQANKATNRMGLAGNQNIIRNLTLSGMGNNNALMQSQLARNARGTSATKANSLIQLLLQGEQIKQNATTQALNYQPLATGQTGSSTTQTSGLGTWLPQLLGAGLQAGLAAATGGGSALATSAGSNSLIKGLNSSLGAQSAFNLQSLLNSQNSAGGYLFSNPFTRYLNQ